MIFTLTHSAAAVGVPKILKSCKKIRKRAFIQKLRRSIAQCVKYLCGFSTKCLKNVLPECPEEQKKDPSEASQVHCLPKLEREALNIFHSFSFYSYSRSSLRSALRGLGRVAVRRRSSLVICSSFFVQIDNFRLR